ncbi:MAG: hypothetical protein H6670_00570 [Anaerolineaceae bacterium]|nr:hypothetical protein [Anaerolineaceae bacterium]
MSNKNSLIREIRELLEEIRVKVQSDHEDSVIHQLDKAILKLEELDSTEPKSHHVALEVLGLALKSLPAIKVLMEVFGDLL